jgi:hypothetical protein
LRKFGIDRARPRHYYNVAARRGRRNQRSNRLAQAPFDCIPDHGVTQLSAYRKADPRAAQTIIAQKEREVGGRSAAPGAKGRFEVPRLDQPLPSLHLLGGPDGTVLTGAAAGGRGKHVAALASTSLDHLDATGRRHPRPKAVHLDPLAFLGLMGALHEGSYDTMAPDSKGWAAYGNSYCMLEIHLL